ncbi:DNA polymerase I [Candidatus Xianfuyuplasma coldseepsis]|uniref:DNA polymerase I n=1 Tax=Candidatus Xianfuyuplasma coldseepsis TaxID=2782163 RepID=A0A7L7KU62_9MOLU|nr:DNA polymerase I [Xianfuyuplasma coldseepsis]QMS85544.1 DNA polymerase I [Xianfuyuplasma coldseepsis]
MKKLILMDGSNVMFRAYYGTAYSGNLMQNSKGQYTNAVFGFVNMMNSVLNEDFTHILVAFDKSGKTFRHESFPDYKGGRKPMPDEFRSQIDLIKKSLDVLGVKQREIELIEADDIIGTYATKYYDQFDEIEIISNDKDLLQLVNDKVHLRSSKKGMQNYVSYTPEYMAETMGVTPDLIPDLKGLMGDASDNLPGIPGVGEKTAVKLLKQYGSLQGVIDHMDEIKGKLGERIRAHYQDAILCKQIATIKTDVSFHFSLDEIEYDGVVEEEMLEFYKELELHSLIKRFNRVQPQPKKTFEYTLVDTVLDIKDILEPDSCIVLETYGTNYHQAQALGFGVVNDKGSYYIPYEMIHQSMDLQLFLRDESIPKSVFDWKMMRVVLLNDQYDIQGVTFDLLLAAYILNPNNTKEDFRVIVSNFEYLDVSYKEEVYGKGAKYAIPTEEAYQMYAVKKAVAIHELKQPLLDQLKDNEQLDLFTDIELPLSRILAKMEHTGIRVDRDKLQQLNSELKAKIDQITEEIYADAGEEFNISSPKQLGVILFEKLELPFAKRTKSGYSTKVDILEKLVDHHPIIEKIMTYRTLTKLHSTYIIGLDAAIMDDGRIHTIYRQAFTSTGRLSSVEPNLQNIPIRYEEGREIRKVFIPEQQHQLLACDYSQIELRVLAHMANEKVMIDAFKHNEDIHTKTAKQIFDKEDITSLERRQAKAVNFGIIYGQSAWGLSEGIHINKKEAQLFIDKYYQQFPGIKQFMDGVVEGATSNGYAETIYHRRRYIPELNSSVYMQRESGKRNAMNAPIQGSAADIIKIAMIELDRVMKEQKVQSKMLLQIHDELIFDVAPDEIDLMNDLVTTTMEQCVSLQVPLKVEAVLGDNLYETK